jgi:AmmeMemoRadiSam system protein B
VFVIRDRQDPEAEAVVVSEAGLLLASLFDGQRSPGAVAAALALRTGAAVTSEQVAGFAEQLDRALLLESPRYLDHLAGLRSAYFGLELRPAIHAGGAYPGTRDELRGFLDALYNHEDGPGGPPGPASGRQAIGLIAPHIDLYRGGPTYAWTYRALAETRPAEVYLLLGTCHLPMDSPLAASRKAYDTPFGEAPIARDLLGALERHYPGVLYADEFCHRGEHSLEFQAVFLRYLQRVGQSVGAIVPLLCGSLQQWVEPGRSPGDTPRIAETVAALRGAVAKSGRRVCVVAGADLAHVGPQFGDSDPVDRSFAARVERRDAEMLERICQGDSEGFYRQVMADQDARRICGLAPIYYLLAMLGPAEGRLLRYSQWIDERGAGSVTYAGVIFER